MERFGSKTELQGQREVQRVERGDRGMNWVGIERDIAKYVFGLYCSCCRSAKPALSSIAVCYHLFYRRQTTLKNTIRAKESIKGNILNISKALYSKTSPLSVNDTLYRV
jgi:hypothetical protein